MSKLDEMNEALRPARDEQGYTITQNDYETQLQAAYAQGQEDMRERAALVADDAYPSHTLGGEAKAISTAIRALPIEGEQG